MTEKVLQTIEKKAFSKWDLSAVRIVHRVGILKLNDPIVAVVVASPHRNNAFDACRFIIDFLKTEAPFWKKEVTNKGAYWVEDKKSDLKQSISWKKEG
jgi:molybdopterin synthase catalytic subunit